MKRAEWNGAVLAESADVVEVEGNVYFPASALRREHFRDSPTHTGLPLEGHRQLLPRGGG
jgi:uncharacterized protein (DUF427 family)